MSRRKVNNSMPPRNGMQRCHEGEGVGQDLSAQGRFWGFEGKLVFLPALEFRVRNQLQGHCIVLL